MFYAVIRMLPIATACPPSLASGICFAFSRSTPVAVTRQSEMSLAFLVSALCDYAHQAQQLAHILEQRCVARPKMIFTANCVPSWWTVSRMRAKPAKRTIRVHSKYLNSSPYHSSALPQSIGYSPMETYRWNDDQGQSHPLHQAMFERVDVNVIYAPLEVTLVSASVLKEPPLPHAKLSTFRRLSD